MENRFSLEDSWAHLGNVLLMAFALFGAPALVAARLIMRRKDRQDLLKWFAPLEALARRLLAIEAARLPARNDAPDFHPQGRILSAMRDTPATDLPEDPAQWRVRFVAWSGPSKRQVSETLTIRGRAASQYNAITLARRLEALRRLIENRGNEVQRLARMIAAHRTEARRRFAPFLYPGPVTTPLAEAQIELEVAFAANTS